MESAKTQSANELVRTHFSPLSTAKTNDKSKNLRRNGIKARKVMVDFKFDTLYR